MALFRVFPGRKISWCGEVGVLIDMDEKASFFDPSFPKSVMPERKGMIVIIHDPGGYFRIFQKDKVFESFA